MTEPRKKRPNAGNRAAAAAGIAGPAAFTGAWIAGSLRQTGHRGTEIQLSGLAASDARDPWIMLTGFLVLGGCTIAFGAALHDALGGRGHAGLAPRLIQGAGVLTIAAEPCCWPRGSAATPDGSRGGHGCWRAPRPPPRS